MAENSIAPKLEVEGTERRRGLTSGRIKFLETGRLWSGVGLLLCSQGIVPRELWMLGLDNSVGGTGAVIQVLEACLAEANGCYKDSAFLFSRALCRFRQ